MSWTVIKKFLHLIVRFLAEMSRYNKVSLPLQQSRVVFSTTVENIAQLSNLTEFEILNAAKGFYFLIYDFVSVGICWVPRDGMEAGGWHNVQVPTHKLGISFFVSPCFESTYLQVSTWSFTNIWGLLAVFHLFEAIHIWLVLCLSNNLCLNERTLFLFPTAYFHMNCRKLKITLET